MVHLPPDWDADAPGSRFTARVAVAIPAREGYMHRAEAGEAQVADEVITAALGPEARTVRGLGELQIVDGSLGRGAAGWCAVAEWTLDAVGQGVVAGAAWVSLISGARWLRQRLDRLQGAGQRALVSRGAAVVLAIGHVLDQTEETGVLVVEAAEDPVTMSGAQPSELGYAGIEPWLVSLVDVELTRRYVVAISASGEPLSIMSMPMTEVEKLYSRLPVQEEPDT